jgi:hypothetical protein
MMTLLASTIPAARKAPAAVAATPVATAPARNTSRREIFIRVSPKIRF